MRWLSSARPPVPHDQPAYWANVAQIIQSSRPMLPNVGQRRAPPGTTGTAWQPPQSGQSLMGEGVVSQ